MSGLRKGYCDGPFGQIHWRSCGEPTAKPDLICLHPAPFSGLAFTTIMPFLAQDRRVIAPDYPGHGGSDPHRTDADIAEYAAAVESLIQVFSPQKPVDLVGFHTGCLVACETALRYAEDVLNLVLIDVPAFDSAMRNKFLASSAAPPGITQELDSLAPAWERGITKRVASQGMARSLEMFVEHLRHGEAMNAAFHAGFTYPVEEGLSQLAHPVRIIATQSMLLEATRRAASLIPDAILIERLDITRAVLDEAAETTAKSVLEALST